MDVLCATKEKQRKRQSKPNSVDVIKRPGVAGAVLQTPL